jgi:hypothetical protein
MTRRALLFSLLLLPLLTLQTATPACAKGKIEGQSLAVVSLSVSDWGGMVRSGNWAGSPTQLLMQKETATMVAMTETELGKRWQVKPVSSFIADPAFRKLAVDNQLSAILPQIDGQELPLFTTNSGALKKCDIAPETATALCALLKVDAVVVVFSEWASKTGGFVPTTKAVAKNLIGVWDASGKKVAFDRIDMMGEKTLGMGGGMTVNETTIGEWTTAYQKSLVKILEKF